MPADESLSREAVMPRIYVTLRVEIRSDRPHSEYAAALARSLRADLIEQEERDGATQSATVSVEDYGNVED